MGPLPCRPRGIGAGPRVRPALVLAAALVTVLAGAARAQAPDSLRWRFELGAGTDVSNELFYEDAFVDTTFLERRLVGTPETRWSAIGLVALDGARAAGRTRFTLLNEASVGDLLQRDALSLAWRGEPGPGWTLAFRPRVEYRRDRTFGRDLEQWSGEAGARARRLFDDGETGLEFGLGGDVLRSAGEGAAFLPDRFSGRVDAALERSGLFGPEWRVGYRLAVRSFPDSSVRDHAEHGAEAHVRVGDLSGSSLALETELTARSPWRAAPTSRDDFVEGRAGLDGIVRAGDSWSVRAALEVETTRYAVEDSTLYFDYTVARARCGPRFSADAGWSLELGARGERLRAALAPSEDYDEAAGYAGFEWLGGGGWWSVTPVGGWRDYGGAPENGWPSIHSSFAFLEAGVLGDQPLPGSLRFRVTGTARVEWHLDESQDARSLYFSFELRRLF
jgi:hypothetical protein